MMENRQLAPILQGKDITMSSREIAELVERRHDNVKRTIETLAERGAITLPQIEETSFVDKIGKTQRTSEYIFKGEQGKIDSCIVVAQLSPEFTARIVKRWFELEKQITTKATSLTAYDKDIISNMIKNCADLIIKEELQNLIPALVEPLVKDKSPASNILIRHGKTAGEIWLENNLPSLKNAALWFGNRLDEMGCAVEGSARAEIGGRTARLFDPDKANICLRNGLLHAVRLYVSVRQGQDKLRLIKLSCQEAKP